MTDDHRVLVPVEVLEGETIAPGVVELLATLPVTVLGYHELPEQTPPGQARLQFEDRAQTKLDTLVEEFRAAGGDAETVLVFTQDPEQTIERVADEADCTAILHSNPVGDVDSLLVAVRDAADADRLATFAARVVGDRPIGVTLYHVVGDDDETATGEELLARAAERLDASVTVDREIVTDRSKMDAIATAVDDHEAVVMGESNRSLRELLFGEASEWVADRSLGPVLVVRTPDDAVPDESDSVLGDSESVPDESETGPDVPSPAPDESETGSDAA